MIRQLLYIPLGLFISFFSVAQDHGFRSPIDIAFSPDGNTLAVTDFTMGSVYFVDVESRRLIHEMAGFKKPFGLVWIDNAKLAVSEYAAHRISLLDARKHKQTGSIPCVKYPMGIALSKHDRLLVTGFGKGELGIIDLYEEKQVQVFQLWYQPDFVAASADGEFALVSNLTPKSSQSGAQISMVTLSGENEVRHIELPFGSTNLRQVKVSPDGKWGYVVHTYGKVMLPTTQIERGWINTNVLSIIDISAQKLYATLPFDYTMKGAADPWGLALSEDGKILYASLAGVNEVAVLKLDLLHDYLSGVSKPENLRRNDANAEIASNVWDKVYEDPSRRGLLSDQFAALYAAGLLERFPLSVVNPRGLAISPDGSSLVSTGYYSAELSWFDLNRKRVSGKVNLGSEPEMTLARKGEMVFHDANTSLQNWLSCVSCHPAGRADGLNWDLMNDGIGSPKNAKSLLYSHVTPPSMSTGIRANYGVAVKAGFHYIKFVEVEEETESAVMAYLSSLKPDPSPYLNHAGKLSSMALRGKALFESDKLGCVNCHTGPYLTDQKMHNVGTMGTYDRSGDFDTPTLRELWRTAPYLHDGSASSLEELFSPERIRKHRLGSTGHLSQAELVSLIEYLKSL